MERLIDQIKLLRSQITYSFKINFKHIRSKKGGEMGGVNTHRVRYKQMGRNTDLGSGIYSVYMY
jgi:hypothetical protein